MVANLASAYKVIVKGWERKGIDNFAICDGVVGRMHLAVQEVKSWEGENSHHKGFFLNNAKKTKEFMMKKLTDNKPVLSLVISPPDLRTVDEDHLRNSHTLLYIVVGRNHGEREGWGVQRPGNQTAISCLI
jgi:hypothetical protein